MTNAELIKQLRGCKDIEFCSDCPRMPNGVIEPCDIKDAAADALEAAEKRIAELEKEHNKTVTEIFGEEQLWWENRCKELEAQLPKRGEWIIDGMNEYELSYGCIGYEPRYRCSKCGITTESYLRTERPIMPEDADFPNYCPSCGARCK